MFNLSFFICLGLYRNVTALKNRKQDLKILLTVGGNRAMNENLWINLVTNPAKMNNFLATLGQIIRTNNFDGLNIDWKPKENHKVRPDTVKHL